MRDGCTPLRFDSCSDGSDGRVKQRAELISESEVRRLELCGQGTAHVLRKLKGAIANSDFGFAIGDQVTELDVRVA